MRISINLASEPFSKDRPLIIASAVCSVALVVLLVSQVYLILGQREEATENREAVAALTAERNQTNQQQAELDAMIREPDNAEVLERSVLLNALIDRKGISWTRLFADIEGVLPNRVRLMQIRMPEVTSSNQVTLDMEVGAESPEQAIEFVRRLEQSPLFGNTNMSRSDSPTERDPLWRVRLTVSYAQQL